jgi:hypothetical protein
MGQDECVERFQLMVVHPSGRSSTIIIGLHVLRLRSRLLISVSRTTKDSTLIKLHLNRASVMVQAVKKGLRPKPKASEMRGLPERNELNIGMIAYKN